MTVSYKILDYSLRNLKMEKRIWVMLAIFLLVACCGFAITFPYMLSRTMILSLFFAIGVLCRNYEKQIVLFTQNYKYAIIVCIGIFAITGHYFEANMGANEYKSCTLFVFGAFCMSYSLICVSYMVCKLGHKVIQYLKKVLVSLGRHSLDIVIWHFVFFRFVIILQIYLNTEEISVRNVLSYYPTYNTNSGWWIVYILVGLILPLLWCDFLRSGPWGRLLKKLHIV